jgi:hypothetical protein
VHIGFRGNSRYLSSKDKVKFKKILPTLEYGSKKRNIPARPLIRPIIKVTRKNITRVWDRFEVVIRADGVTKLPNDLRKR